VALPERDLLVAVRSREDHGRACPVRSGSEAPIAVHAGAVAVTEMF
jgi:hypothetical protein